MGQQQHDADSIMLDVVFVQLHDNHGGLDEYSSYNHCFELLYYYKLFGVFGVDFLQFFFDFLLFAELFQLCMEYVLNLGLPVLLQHKLLSLLHKDAIFAWNSLSLKLLLLNF
jgi:hypothetical protein